MQDSFRPSPLAPRALVVAVIAMGIVLVFGTVALLVAIIMRGHGHAASQTGSTMLAAPQVPVDLASEVVALHLKEPPGSRILGVAPVGPDVLAVTVGDSGSEASQRGDRIVLVDIAHRRVVARVAVN